MIIKKWNKGGMLGNIIGSFIVLLVGFSLLPVISDKLKSINLNNSTGVSSTVLELVSIIFIISIFIIALTIGFQALRSAGLLGGESYNDYDPELEGEVKNKSHKQTYLEFVKERLSVERLMGGRKIVWK